MCVGAWLSKKLNRVPLSLSQLGVTVCLWDILRSLIGNYWGKCESEMTFRMVCAAGVKV